jgi:hypothetical protein
LLACVALLRDDARRDYECARLEWATLAAAGAKIDPPEVPAILERAF